MRLAFITTFAPQPCGIATYTGYLINGLRSLGKNLRVRVVAEDKAAAYQDSFLEVLPIWHRNTDFSRSIIENTENFDVVHLQHEFGIFGYDQRTVKTLGRLKGVGKKVIT
ncbi:MAG: hypothetical protein N2748_03370, partial [candidate division WOR-3 bacterium]|nr:hypothetical protein [candidate division WOR-3 bacterium]